MMAVIKWPFVMVGAGLVAGAAGLASLLAAQRIEVSAWTGIAAINDPHGTIKRCRECGIDRLSIFVNQEPALTAKWNTYDRGDIIRACGIFRAAGLKVGLVSWMMSNPDWIAGAAEFGQLCTDAGADEAEFDLEWEWTAALYSKSDEYIRKVTRQLFANVRSTFRGDVLVDHIVYTDLRIVGPAIAESDGCIPQAYATAKYTSALPPGQLERVAVKRFAPFRKPIILGVAGWNQEGAYGFKRYVDAMRASLASATALGIRRVRVWRLEQIDVHEGAELLAFKGAANTRTA